MPPPTRPAAISAWDWLRSPTAAVDAGDCGLAWRPSQIDACVAARAAAPVAPLTEDELGELRAAHRRWDADAASLAAIEALGQPNTRIVATGQQPALLAGPLLTIYKTLGAVALCRDLATKHPELRFVPVFWVASEDHDFDEVRGASWLNKEGGLQSFALEATADRAGRMVGPLAAPEAVEPLLKTIREATFDTEFKEAALDLIGRAYAGPADLETGFCRLLLRLMRGMGLVVVSPLMPWLRRRAVPLLQGDLARAGEASRAVNERGELQRRAGLTPALKRPEGSLNFFQVDDDGRRWQLRVDPDDDARVLAAPSGFDAPARAFDRAELAALLDADPARFSTNVVTRPMLQDAALPTVAQTIGPGEAAYLSLVESVYDDFGVFAPVRWPRPRAALLEPRLERRLAKHGLMPDAADGRDAGTLLDVLLRREGEGSLLARAEQLRETQLAQLQELAAELPGDPGLTGAVGRLAQALGKGYDKLDERLAEHGRRQAGQLRGDAELIAAALNPNGQPQERVFNPIVPYAVNYGLDWVAALGARLSIDPAAGVQAISMADLARPGGSRMP